MHGHRWTVEAVVGACALDGSGMAFDFIAFRELLLGIISPFDHQVLNEVSPFDRIPPTAENIAEYIYNEMATALPPGIIPVEVKVWESPQAWASYCSGEPSAFGCRVIESGQLDTK